MLFMPRLALTSCLIGITWSSECNVSQMDADLCKKSPVVRTSNGLVQGFDRKSEGQAVSTFWGLPFAEPPIGALRFHYPRPFGGTWSQTRAAIKRSARCPQSLASSNTTEDCLYLNVFTPRKAIGSSVGLPVMFWIYGGGYTIGDAYMSLPGGDLYDGLHLAARHDVVVVTSNYRLNALGFNTYTKGIFGQTGTQAMEDQRLAMQWTQTNIHEFGGDPSRVMIFGESAGAFSVMYHLVSPPSWPLFSRAIMQSGTSELSWFFQPLDLATDLSQGWATAVGCPDAPNQLTCLQALPAGSFVNPPTDYVGRSPVYPVFPFGPIIDGTAHGLLDVPFNLVQAGKFAKVPLLIGANRDGGTIFEPMIAGIVPGVKKHCKSQKDIDSVLKWAFKDTDQTRIHEAYPQSEYQHLGKSIFRTMMARMMRDLGFQCSDRRLASQWHAHGLAAYVYTFDFDFGPLDKLLKLGDFHGSDTIFIFRTFLWIARLLPLHRNVDKMADIVSCQWASFAYSGDPNGGLNSSNWPPHCDDIHGHVPQWPYYTEVQEFYNLNSTPVVGHLRQANVFPDDVFPSNEKCDMWDSVSYPWHAKKAREYFLEFV